MLDYSLAALCMERLLRGVGGDNALRLRVLRVFVFSPFAYDMRRVGSPASARQLVLARSAELRRRHPVIRAQELRAVALTIVDA